MIRLQDLAPDYYVDKSRDFQLFCRLYDTCFNSNRWSGNSLSALTDTAHCSNRMLKLLKTKLGFFSSVELNDESLRTVLSVFPELVKYKGSLRAIDYVLNMYQRLYPEVEFYSSYDTELSKYVPYSVINTEKTSTGISNIYTIEIVFSSFPKDDKFLREVLTWVLPTGYLLKFTVKPKQRTRIILRDNLEYHPEDSINSINHSLVGDSTATGKSENLPYDQFELSTTGALVGTAPVVSPTVITLSNNVESALPGSSVEVYVNISETYASKIEFELEYDSEKLNLESSAWNIPNSRQTSKLRSKYCYDLTENTILEGKIATFKFTVKDSITEKCTTSFNILKPIITCPTTFTPVQVVNSTLEIKIPPQLSITNVDVNLDGTWSIDVKVDNVSSDDFYGDAWFGIYDSSVTQEMLNQYRGDAGLSTWDYVWSGRIVQPGTSEFSISSDKFTGLNDSNFWKEKYPNGPVGGCEDLKLILFYSDGENGDGYKIAAEASLALTLPLGVTNITIDEATGYWRVDLWAENFGSSFKPDAWFGVYDRSVTQEQLTSLRGAAGLSTWAYIKTSDKGSYGDATAPSGRIEFYIDSTNPTGLAGNNIWRDKYGEDGLMEGAIGLTDLKIVLFYSDGQYGIDGYIVAGEVEFELVPKNTP